MGFFGILLMVIATLIGIYLIFVSGWGLIPLIVYGILAGWFYTSEGRKFSFINWAPGIAELLIATTYGVFMTMGAYFVLTGSYSLQAFLISLPVAFFISNVLLINQFPDADSDAKTGKNTLVVRIGKRSATMVLIGCFLIGYIIIAILPLIDYAPYSIYYSFLSIPFAFQAIRYAWSNYDKNAADMIPSNAHTAINHLFNGLLLVFAFLLEELTLAIPLIFLAASLLLVFWVWNYIERQRRVMNDFRNAFKSK